MHGSIFVELRQFVFTTFGEGHWEAILESAHIGHKSYVATQIYPDLEAVRIVAAASDRTQLPMHGLLESFGEFLATSLIARYESLIDPEWRTLDLLEHVEETIHIVIRAGDSAANPPSLMSRRLNPREVVIDYDSPRKMCSLAKGLIHGVARHYSEAITLDEPLCMLRGDAICQLWVTTAKS